MLIGRIPGCTRVIGRAQGYLGLPLRDVALDCSVNGAGTPAMETAWLPTPKEMAAIAAGAPVILRVLGTAHPPVMLFAGEGDSHPAMAETISDQVDTALEQLGRDLLKRAQAYLAAALDAEERSAGEERFAAVTAAAVLTTVIDQITARRTTLKAGTHG